MHFQLNAKGTLSAHGKPDLQFFLSFIPSLELQYRVETAVKNSDWAFTYIHLAHAAHKVTSL